MQRRLHQFLTSPVSIGLVSLAMSSGCSMNPWRTLMVSKPSPPAQEPATKLLRQVDDRARAEACRAAAMELVRTGHDEPAIEQLLRARQFETDFPGIAHPLAVLYDRLGKFSEAEREYAAALKESPRDARVWSDYGYFLYERGELSQAEEALRKATRLDPKLQTASINLGLVLAEQRRYDDAQEVFRSSIGEAAAQFNIGVVMARHGDETAARALFESAIRLDPGLSQSVQALACLDNSDTGTAVIPATFTTSAEAP